MPVQPLAGVTVFENDSFVAGPSACLALSQLGAQVIKIDPIKGGPDIDRWPITPEGRSIYWGSLNRNKRSVAIDLRSEEGQELAQALITSPGDDSGVFVENNVGRPFLSDEVLRAKRADLVHVKVQGSADGGPGVDYTVNAEAGIPMITGPTGVEGPSNHALPAWDLVCGQAAVTAVVTGLYHRRATGEGLYQEIALKDIALAAVANLGWYTETLQPAGERTKHGNHIFGSFGTNFATGDERHVMVTAITRRQWSNLVKVTGMSDVVAALERSLSTDFTEETNRYTYREVLEALLKPWFASRTANQITADLEGSGVLWAPYSSLGEVTQDALAGDGAGVLRTLESDALGTMLVGASPIRVDGEYLADEKPTVFGADTAEVLSERLGLGSAEIGRLCDEGIIAS
ncbi:CoA transferase [Brevibacterium daeguense]|uniref:CoA transferase n=1 Tax=Brevibacterium daeguense TaxID=909936 RepID=A0ABP8EHQ0_9MICO|nr:CoA transferase [Brevibacterium daeguense]